MQPIRQTPPPGAGMARVQGDTVTFFLNTGSALDGDAFLRTNLGRARVRRREIIESVEQRQPALAHDWHDLPMAQEGPGRYRVCLPLLEPGCFEAKAFLLPRGQSGPLWPAGPNVYVKVQPAAHARANTIYAAFVRQFGPHCERLVVAPTHDSAIRDLDREGFAVIPRSGTFRDLIRRLDVVLGRLRCRILLLLPIHPTPTTYARMGRFGSPFAVLDYLDVDPALAEFDRRSTPLEQFRELLDAVHARGARLFMDIPANHTGWASSLQVHHPEWFVRHEDRTFRSPGAWGVTWEDLSELDYRHRDLWRFMAGVFLYWCRQGVDGFRCDAGYMVPRPVWEYIAAKVRDEYPETLFLLEGLGGPREVTESLLREGNLNWAYSELFERYGPADVADYATHATAVSADRGVLVHFAETHDNSRLAAVSPRYSRFRCALSALLSHSGGFGITNGVEWFAAEKIDVHGAPSLNWGAETNQVDFVGRLNALLAVHPCFAPEARTEWVHTPDSGALVMRRSCGDPVRSLLVLLNFRMDAAAEARWPDRAAAGPRSAPDLLAGGRVAVESREGTAVCSVPAAGVLCLACDARDVEILEQGLLAEAPQAVSNDVYRLRAKAFSVHVALRGYGDVAGLDMDRAVAAMQEDPRQFCATVSAAGAGVERAAAPLFAPVAVWQWPRDARRTVLVPDGQFLLILSPHRFRARLEVEGKTLRHEWGLPWRGGFFALLEPSDDGEDRAAGAELDLTVLGPGGAERQRAPVLLIGRRRAARARTAFNAEEAEAAGSYAVLTNGLGAMAQARWNFGEIVSQYDCLLGANLHARFPVDRHILLTRCRAWIVYKGYSAAVNRECLESFAVPGDGSALWRFCVPCGMGKTVAVQARLRMQDGRNAVHLDWARPLCGGVPDALPDSEPVKLILRPDLEDRSCHATTKAYAGPEGEWPRAVASGADGFRFVPASERALDVRVSRGRYVHEPEWQYMVGHPFEAARGLEGSGDLFSPGYFGVPLAGGDTSRLSARVAVDASAPPAMPVAEPDPMVPPGAAFERDLEETLRGAVRQFIAKRDDSLTLIAGFPWFLDWGRDTLIGLRGLVAGGWLREAREILVQFARFEQDGTLPNMIRGGDHSDRDTSDAPLWFGVACSDLLEAEGGAGFLDADCGGRSLRDVLLSIAGGYLRGTFNGIRVDADSLLVFSPAHFTWMDTNHPAGTPREGYPIEIQALWHALLRLLAREVCEQPWAGYAARVRDSIARHYPLAAEGYLADCLHGPAGRAAAEAPADDALRPNQLLAVTLGAVQDANLGASILAACEELLVPGAVRSLADRPVRVPLPVVHGGRVLNDPACPYWGQYRGDEDTRRKPAYHNGTAWTWLFPSYPEAMVKVFGEPARDAALAVLRSALEPLNRGCVGHVPEILDGDSPHAERGCGAQAWGATELLRVLLLLNAERRT